MFHINYNCLNKCIDNSCNECYQKDNDNNEICNRRYQRFENRHNKYEYVHSSSRLERLKYDTIMRTNIKNRKAIDNRIDGCGKKQIMTGYKNGRYPGTKERFTGWMFNNYHPETRRGTYYYIGKKENIKHIKQIKKLANNRVYLYTDLNCKEKPQKEHCCKNYDYNSFTKKRF